MKCCRDVRDGRCGDVRNIVEKVMNKKVATWISFLIGIGTDLVDCPPYRKGEDYVGSDYISVIRNFNERAGCL